MFWTYLLLSVFIFGLAWYPCCCADDPHGCVNCSGSGDNAPEFFTCVLDAFADDTCADCDTLNGTYILPPEVFADPIIFPCQWLFRPPTICTSLGTTLRLTVATSNTITAAVGIGCPGGATTEFYTYAKTFGAAPDCLELVDEVFTFSSHSTQSACASADRCDGSSATVTVSSGS